MLRSLAIVINATKPGALALAETLAAIAKKNGTSTSLTHNFPIPENFLQSHDACCVIGGDGTLLSIAPEAALLGIPVIGVNRGSLGFLTTFSADEAQSRLPSILSGNYRLSPRTLIEALAAPNSHPQLALNEALVKTDTHARIRHLEVLANNELVTDYYCDGLIFSTPTGSTAYNLSAGGPLIHPASNVIAMTPICPHTLSNRSIIFPSDTTLQVRNRDPESKLTLSLDGRPPAAISASTPITIRLSPKPLNLIQDPDHSHYHILRTKLKWSTALTP